MSAKDIRILCSDCLFHSVCHGVCIIYKFLNGSLETCDFSVCICNFLILNHYLMLFDNDHISDSDSF